MHAICVETCAVARYARLPGMPGCPAVRLPGNMPGCPEICPVARKYARLPGNMSGCLEICPAARYARLSGNMPGCPEICPAARYARLPGNMPGMFGSPTSALRLRLDAQRTASVAPLAAFIDRHKRWHATSSVNRAQPTGRASGVNCTQCWAAR